MQAAQYVAPMQGFSSTYDAAQMVQSQYFAPGLYAAEPQPISYDGGATSGLLHAMPVHEPVMVPPVARPQVTSVSFVRDLPNLVPFVTQSDAAAHWGFGAGQSDVGRFQQEEKRCHPQPGIYD